MLSACAMQRAVDAESAQKQMTGMTKEQIFACMGIPRRKASEGGTEIWSYKSGNDRKEKSKDYIYPKAERKMTQDGIADVIGTTLSFGDEVEERRFCNIQIVMKEGRVRAVNYSGPTGGLLTEDEQCAYATKNCVK
jgi:hypothetical protein